MKRILKAFLIVILTLFGVAVIFGVAMLLYEGCGHVMSAIELYWEVAKNHVVETIIFYAIWAIVLLIIELIVNAIANKKEKED